MTTPENPSTPIQELQATNALYWSLQHGGMSERQATEISATIQKELDSKPNREEVEKLLTDVRNSSLKWENDLLRRAMWLLLTVLGVVAGGIISAVISKVL